MLVLLTFRNVQGSELLRASHSEMRENVSVENHSFFPNLADFQLNNHMTEIFSKGRRSLGTGPKKHTNGTNPRKKPGARTENQWL